MLFYVCMLLYVYSKWAALASIMHRISSCIHIPARNHACITPDPWAETSKQESSTMCHEMKNDRQDCGMVFCCRVALLCIHVLPEAHNTLPYPATAQHRPLGNDSPIFACLLDFRGLNPWIGGCAIFSTNDTTRRVWWIGKGFFLYYRAPISSVLILCTLHSPYSWS